MPKLPDISAATKQFDALDFKITKERFLMPRITLRLTSRAYCSLRF